ncbi:MAG TPA: integrase core domain-containing protein [Candidatus Tectomicrobia bacterium]|nr:integrase core domain-containing protein [Candidatus Tectomicrobia bacterium]
MKACSTLGVYQAFTSYNNPKGNADTERFVRTLKEECLWLQEWTCPLELFKALTRWINQYNKHYLHSTLGYKPPRQFELKERCCGEDILARDLQARWVE